MSNWNKSVIYGGIYASTLHQEKRAEYGAQYSQKYRDLIEKIENLQEFTQKFLEKSKKTLVPIKNNLKSHISRKQEVYWPVLVAIILLLFVFASKIAFAEMSGMPNNLPLESKGKLNVVGFQKKNIRPNVLAFEKIETESDSDLKSDVAGIVKNTPMAAMVDPISEKDRTVAAFIVGIAMKESKFGVYSPKLGGRDCYNYWGFKGGGKTVAGGYTCFGSPEDAVDAVGKRIEKMVAKGVRSPAQAIGWKCGSSCAGHDPSGVRKWIADVAINFNKINS